MARLALARASSAIAVSAVALALLRSVAAVWFSSEVVATPANEEVAAPALSDRVVLVVIDGLRYDTALESDLMPRLQAIAAAGSQGESLASKVTMTGLGVRTLGTATSPALADILLEAQLPPVTFDNIFASLRRRGGHIAWLGNPSWKELFGAYIDLDAKIDRELEIMSRVNNVWAADRVIVRRAISLLADDRWQLCIVHLGGLDNASHRFTPFGEAFRDKARAVDADLAKLVAAARPGTTVIVTSDHGTSDRGHHGSGEPITRRTPLVLTGAAVAHGGVLHAQQTDVAPTIAALLGLPIPAPSEGQILFDALDMPAASAAALRAANVAQLQRYAVAYAASRGLTAPTIDPTPAGMRRLGEWIEQTRASSGVVPALWAVGLALAALALVGTLAARTTIAASIATVAAAWSIATGGRSVLAAVVAVVAAGAGCTRGLPALPRRWQSIGTGLLAIAGLELALMEWKLHHRFVEMATNDIYASLHVSGQMVQAAATIVAIVVVTLAARRWWPSSPWAAIGALVATAALADSIAIPAAIVVGVSAAAAAAQRRELLGIAAAALAGIVAIAAIDSPAVADLPLGLAAPIVLALAGAWLGPGRRPGRIALVGLGALATVVTAAGNPSMLYRATLATIAIATVALARFERDDRPLEVLGWGGAIALAMLSRSAQLPGLVAWTVFAALVGRLASVAASSDCAVLTATFAAIGVRFACFGLFEGVFEFSHLEVWVAYQGNPGTAVAFGAAIIAIKFALPFAIGLALLTSRMTIEARRATIAWASVFLCVRITHICIGMTVARGTFYSPYLDSGQLVFTYLMIASMPIVVALFAAAGVWVAKNRRWSCVRR